MAIISGICVISTRRARQVPAAVPTANTSAISPSVTTTGRSLFCTLRTTVAARARPIPTMPSTVPRRAVSGLDRPARLRTNRTAATR